MKIRYAFQFAKAVLDKGLYVFSYFLFSFAFFTFLPCESFLMIKLWML